MQRVVRCVARMRAVRFRFRPEWVPHLTLGAGFFLLRRLICRNNISDKMVSLTGEGAILRPFCVRPLSFGSLLDLAKRSLDSPGYGGDGTDGRDRLGKIHGLPDVARVVALAGDIRL